MCLHCVGEYEELFEVMPGLWLSRATMSSPEDNISIGDFALWRDSVNEPTCTFDFVPLAEPYENLTGDEIAHADSELSTKQYSWYDRLESFRKCLHLIPENGYQLVLDAQDNGYQWPDDVAFWLLARIGRMYDEYVSKQALMTEDNTNV